MLVIRNLFNFNYFTDCVTFSSDISSLGTRMACCYQHFLQLKKLLSDFQDLYYLEVKLCRALKTKGTHIDEYLGPKELP